MSVLKAINPDFQKKSKNAQNKTHSKSFNLDSKQQKQIEITLNPSQIT